MKMIGRKTRNILTVHDDPWPKNGIDRLYLSRRKPGKGLNSFQE